MTINLRTVGTVAANALLAIAIFVAVSLTVNSLLIFQKTYNLARQQHENAEEVVQIAERDRNIDAELRELLQHTPGAIFSRVALVYDNGTTTLATSPILRIDNTHTVFGKDTTIPVAEPRQDIPLSQWSGQLADFFADRCVIRKVNDLDNAAYQSRLERSGVGAFVGCPLISPAGHFFGAIYVAWPPGVEPHPSQECLDIVHERARRIAGLFRTGTGFAN